MEDPHFPKRFLQSCLVGFYFRVLEEGSVGADDPIELLEKDPEAMSVREVCRLYYFDRDNVEDCKRVIRIKSLSPGSQAGFEDRLEKAGIPVERAAEREDEMCCGPKGQEVLKD